MQPAAPELPDRGRACITRVRSDMTSAQSQRQPNYATTAVVRHAHLCPQPVERTGWADRWHRLRLQVVYTSFDLERGLMTASSGGMAYPHPAAGALAGALPQLRMLGALLGKALVEGILLDVPLAHFFVTRLQVCDASCHIGCRSCAQGCCPMSTCCMLEDAQSKLVLKVSKMVDRDAVPVESAVYHLLICSCKQQVRRTRFARYPVAHCASVSLLAQCFCCAVQGRRPTFDDLRTVDEDVHRNLLTVKRCACAHCLPRLLILASKVPLPGQATQLKSAQQLGGSFTKTPHVDGRYEGDVEDLCLDFTVEYEAYGKRMSEVRSVEDVHIMQHGFAALIRWCLTDRAGR